MVERVQGYNYVNPGEALAGDFQVVQTNMSSPGAEHFPEDHQEIIHDAWAEQFKGQFTREQIARSADPNNAELVAAQKKRLDSGSQPGGPTYVHARIKVPSVLSPGESWYVAGIGKGAYADGRPRRQRWVSDYVPMEDRLADVSNVFVRTALLGNPRIPLQGKGYGSAILRSLLDAFPGDMPTVMYDYLVNVRLQPVIARLGFVAVDNQRVSRRVTLFGAKVMPIQYNGPLSGELIEKLEAERPWLRDRQPITA